MKKKLISIALIIFIVACSKDSVDSTKTQAYMTLKPNNSEIEKYSGITYHDGYSDPSTSSLITFFFGNRSDGETNTTVNYTICYGLDIPIVRNFQYSVTSEMTTYTKEFKEDENHVLIWNITENSYDGFKATYSGNLINTIVEDEEITVEGTIIIKYGRPYAENPNPEI